MRSLLLVVLVVLPLVVWAEPPNDYRNALQRGRGYQSQRRFREACAAFEAALASRPEDATALSELGASALSLGDLPRARSATERALRHADGDLRCMTLYNLGRIEEASSDVPAAVAAYQRSLDMRQSAAARSRLIALDREAAAGRDPLRPLPMMGPFSSLSEACEDGRCGDGDAKIDDRRSDLQKAAPPFLAVQLLTRASEFSRDFTLAVRLKSGWYLARDVMSEEHNGGLNSSIAKTSFTVGKMIAGGPQLQLRAERQGYNRGERQSDGGRDGSSTEEELLVLCGLGPSQAPSCLPMITLSHTETSESYPLEANATLGPSYSLTPSFKAGVFMLTPSGKAPPELAGPHIVNFP